MKTDRLMTLADGIFAIVMTLLVFEMRVLEPCGFTGRHGDEQIGEVDALVPIPYVAGYVYKN